VNRGYCGRSGCLVIDTRSSLISTTGGRPDFTKFSHKPFYTWAHNFSSIAPNFPIFVSIDIFSYHLSGETVEIIKYAPQENLGFKEATTFSVSGMAYSYEVRVLPPVLPSAWYVINFILMSLHLYDVCHAHRKKN